MIPFSGAVHSIFVCGTNGYPTANWPLLKINSVPGSSKWADK